MKILLIGHSVEDHLIKDGKEVVSPGGIFYSVMGMTNFLDVNDKLFLLTSIDSTTEQLFRDMYSKVEQDYIQRTEKIPKVHLHHHEGNTERFEHYENITAKLDTGSPGNLNQFDGILINMITGFDITIDDLINLRSKYKGLIYMDVHTLSRGLGENGVRDFRLIPHAEKWIKSVDVLQANESELRTLSTEADELSIAKNVLSAGLKYLIVTKGELGVRAYWVKKGEIGSCFLPATKIVSRNKIGCGDIFGSVFLYTFLKEKDFVKALKIANSAAGCSAGYADFSEFKKIKDDTFARLN